MQPTSSYLVYLLIPVIFGLALAGFGTTFLVLALRARRESQSAQSWSTAAGRIVSTAIHTRAMYSDDGPRVSYEPVVSYEYSVMGSMYQGNRIAFGASSFSRRQAQQVLDRYIQDNPVTVYYDPNRPSEAVLERSAKGTTIFTAVGLVFVIIGSGICCVGAGIGLLMMAAKP